MHEVESKKKYLIIGGVAGGATAAARIRRLSEQAEIILLERGEHISYANCGLPYYIGGVIQQRDRLFVQTPAAFARRFNIDVRTQSEATSIDPERQKVSIRTADGRSYTEHYDELLLSPGSAPLRPALPGIDLEGIFTLRNVADTDRIKAYLEGHQAKRAVIVGGGFIGLEMAENLHQLGLEVSLVEMAPQVMAPMDYSMAAFVHEELQSKGVALYLEEAIAAFERVGEGLQLRFQSGATLAADLVLLSIGVRPETKLAQEAGLKLGETKGIWVNEYLQTSEAHIWAVGDAIEYPHPVTGQPWLNYLAGPANRQARIVADNMVLGAQQRYEGSVGTAIAKVFDLTVATTGLPAKRLKQLGIPYLSATIHAASHAGYYPGARQMAIKVTFAPSDGRIYGAQIVGYDGVDTRIDQYALALKCGMTVAELTELEQAYAPPFSSAKDPVAISAYVAENIRSGRMQPLYWRELREADLSKVALIDVRTPEEYALGTIPGAVNVPLDELRERLAELPRDRALWLFCGVGLRGYLASNILRGQGFSEVRNLVGGIKTYRAATAVIQRPSDPHAGGARAKAAAEQPATETQPEPAAAPELRVLDACGLQCPGPILQLRRAMDELPVGARLEVRATDVGFPRDAEAWCRSTGHRFVGSRSEGGVYIVQLEKASVCAQEASRPASAGPRNKTFILFDDDLDKALATFILANGAAATGGQVSIFFTFWGLNVLKREHKPRVAKDFFGRMFGWMLPSDSTKLPLSKMNFLGLGPRMMRYLMKQKGVDSVETLRQQALAAGVEFIACQMSMDVMGIRREELLDEVTVGGVASYMERAEQAGVNLFI